MQQAKAKLSMIRIAPRKVKVVLDLIRGKDLVLARAILKNTPKAASVPVLKLVNSAAANAENNFNMDPTKLYVKTCFVSEGPTLKRIRPRAKGSANQILKRTSNIVVVLEEKED